ncbi:hypothetical protein LDO26_11115 [Luteimonas sp. BDR2-5]|uniref:hypothetical protein n=1 Tax=Proluteimonas luteida TaxID=2878685 RepID=UPI001E4AE618|nr:hypothetical protein [Luteimonas sp. BDR2-5]MCD9028756.1 hypothetical protein [Luteimonas sp. BDR2-5]
MIPWPGWAYLALLALVGLSGFALALRAGQPKPLAALRLLAVGVLAWGVVLYFRDAGAGLGFAAALFAAVLVLAHKSTTDAQQARELGLGRAGRAGVAINGLLALPAVALGALAIWARHGG